MKKILHITTSLGNGGAEGVITRLILNDKKNTHEVICLNDKGFYGDILKKNRIKLHLIKINKGKFSIFKIIKLFFLIKKNHFDIVQTWMYKADIIGGLICYLLNRKNIYWNVRHSNFSKNKEIFKTFLILRLSAFLSKFIPKKIIFCSKSGKLFHESQGFKKNKSIIIYNGFDNNIFKPRLNKKNEFKKRYKISKDILIFGYIARYHHQKDHATLFQALCNLKISNWKIILIGDGINKKNKEFLNLIEKFNLKNKVLILKQTKKINEIYNVLDLNFSTSAYGEGFPNVVAEALLSGVTTIGSDVGDTKYIINNKKYIFEKTNIDSLLSRINYFLKNHNSDQKEYLNSIGISRDRIMRIFSIEKMVQNYIDCWNK